MEQLCKDFLERYSLSSHIEIEQDEVAIYWLEKSNLHIAQSAINNDKLLFDPSWGYITFTLDRAYQHTAGSLILYLIGMKSSSEALSRVAFESSVNALYILNYPNRMERIFQYLSTHIVEERNQNQKWKKSIQTLKSTDQIPQKRGIEQKEKFLDLAEIFLEKAAHQVNISYPTKRLSVNTFDKFQDLNRVNAYRTIYAAMSSQIHNDAEDFLNKFLLNSRNYQDEDQKSKYLQSLELETENFSRLMVYSSLQYFLEASLMYCKCFGLDNILETISQGYATISEFTEDIAKNSNPHLFE